MEAFTDFVTRPYIGTALAFILGAVAGSFLNVCIARIPLQKSILWPSSRCGTCFQPVRFSDNIPLISYWRLGGRCRSCQTPFSMRYFWIELLTAVAFAGLFLLDVVWWDLGRIGVFEGLRPLPIQQLGVWLCHVAFFSLLIVATFADIDYQEIPLAVTIPGTLLGVLVGALAPWPWPLPAEPLPPELGLRINWQAVAAYHFLPIGLQPWPAWTLSFDWLQPGTWSFGLMNSVVGAIVGTGLMRLIRFIFSWGLRKEAMGLGDADLMMMIGAFLGWQSVFFVLGFGVFLGLLYAIYLIIANRGSELPFGPFLAAGAVLTIVFFPYLENFFQSFFFNLPLIVALSILAGVLAFFLTMTMRMVRLVFDAA